MVIKTGDVNLMGERPVTVDHKSLVLVYTEDAVWKRKNAEWFDKSKPVHVQEGDIVRCFRGDWFKVKSIERPRNAASTGRIYVVDTDEKGSYEGACVSGFFPSVFECQWVPK